MTQKEKDRIRGALVAFNAGDKKSGLSILADLVKPNWRKDAIASIVKDVVECKPEKKAEKKAARKPRVKKVKETPLTPVTSEPEETAV